MNLNCLLCDETNSVQKNKLEFWIVILFITSIGSLFAIYEILTRYNIVKNTCPTNCVEIQCYIPMSNYIDTGKCTCSYIINNSTISICRDYIDTTSSIEKPFDVLIYFIGLIFVISTGYLIVLVWLFYDFCCKKKTNSDSNSNESEHFIKQYLI